MFSKVFIANRGRVLSCNKRDKKPPKKHGNIPL
jgi:hypothetical protein